MSALAAVPAAAPAGYEQRVAELVDLEVLVARGLDLARLRLAPAPSDPLFGYARCPMRGCVNVTEHTATSLCSRCQHRYGRWQRTTGGDDLDRFLLEVTQTRSEDPERLCLVCRTPGHERPLAAQGLCFSCLSQAKGRGQSVTDYIAGDERWPPATPRPTFGPCRMTCDALACGGDGLCGEHLRHWHRAGRPAGAAFEEWRERIGEPLPASRYVDLSSLSDTVRWEFLLGLSVAIDGHRRTRISELRRVVSLVAQHKVASIAELDMSGVRTDGVRLFVSWAQDQLRLAFADPDSEWRKDVWDMRVFGKAQAYRIDFTQITQPWLRELAKQWAREHAPVAHAASTRRVVASIGELSRSLDRRDDHGLAPTALGREDIALFVARISRARSAGRVSTRKRSVLVADVSMVLRQARDLELGAEGRPVFGLPASFTLSREEVRRVARVPAPPPARALPDTVVAQLLEPEALGLLEEMHGQRVRIAVELLADTGRRPNEICVLTWDCLDYDEQVDESGQTRKLPILVHDMPKVARTGCWLPIDERTAELITAQKRRIRERYPDTPIGQLRLFPRLQRNPRGAAAMASMELSRVVRRWVTALPALLDSDGEPFDRSRVVPYAFRHSYAPASRRQRHPGGGAARADGAPQHGHHTGLLQGSRRARPPGRRAARAVADRPPRQSHDAARRAARAERAAAPPGRPDRRAAGAVHRAIERQGTRARLRLPLPLRRL